MALYNGYFGHVIYAIQTICKLLIFPKNSLPPTPWLFDDTFLKLKVHADVKNSVNNNLEAKNIL